MVGHSKVEKLLSEWKAWIITNPKRKGYEVF